MAQRNGYHMHADIAEHAGLMEVGVNVPFGKNSEEGSLVQCRKNWNKREREKENKIFIVVCVGMKGSRRWRLEESQEEEAPPQRADLQRVHVIEGMIQLLTGRLVFQLLIVQFVCTPLSRGSRWRKRWIGRRNPEGGRREITRRWKIRKDERSQNEDGVGRGKAYEKPDVPSGHLWSSPAWRRTFLRILHEFQPLDDERR